MAVRPILLAASLAALAVAPAMSAIPAMAAAAVEPESSAAAKIPAADVPVVLMAEADGFEFRLQVGPPDRTLARGAMTPEMASRMLPPAAPGRGGGVPPRSLVARAERGGGGGPAAGPATGPATGPIPGAQVGPIALIDVGDPNASMRLTVAGPRAADILMARVVAVRVETMDVAVAPIRRTRVPGEFATNVALPGKGAYKLIVRALKKDGSPVTAKFDYHR